MYKGNITAGEVVGALYVVAIGLIWLYMSGCATKAQVRRLQYDLAKAVGKSELILKATEIR